MYEFTNPADFYKSEKAEVSVDKLIKLTQQRSIFGKVTNYNLDTNPVKIDKEENEDKRA